MSRILLTGARSPLTLDLARLLALKGHEVYTAETLYMHVCRLSRLVKKNFTIPSPRFNLLGFIDTINEILQREKIDILLPTCEETVYISQYKDRFYDGAHIYCEPFDKIHSLHSKWLFTEKQRKLDIPTPETRLIESHADLRCTKLPYPFALKASYSRASQGVYKVNNPYDNPSVEINPKNPWIAQEWLHGDKYCTYAVANNGRLRAIATYPVEYSIGNNACVSYRSVHHEKIEEWVTTFISKDNFSGQISFDFIEDGGALFAIECNPRATAGIHLFKHADDLSDALFGPEDGPIIRPKEGRECQIGIGMIMYGWRSKSLRKFFQFLFTARDVLYYNEDRTPFILQPICFFYYVWLKIKYRTSLPAAFTYDLDWNG